MRMPAEPQLRNCCRPLQDVPALKPPAIGQRAPAWQHGDAAASRSSHSQAHAPIGAWFPGRPGPCSRQAMEWTPLPAAPESAIMAECEAPQEKGASTMEKTGMIGVGPGKRSFQLHGARGDGSAAFRMKVSRERFLEEMSKRGPCTVAMEVCGGAGLMRLSEPR